MLRHIQNIHLPPKLASTEPTTTPIDQPLTPGIQAPAKNNSCKRSAPAVKAGASTNVTNIFASEAHMGK